MNDSVVKSFYSGAVVFMEVWIT